MSMEVNLSNYANKYVASDEREDYIIYAKGGNDTVTGNDGADSIYGGDGNDSIKGMDGDDIISGDEGNDKLYGGNGADTFVYTLGDGNDTIFDYELEDRIRFISGTPTFKKDGSDLIITVKNGSTSNKITLKNAADKIVTYIDSKGVQRSYPNDVRIEDDDKTITLLKGYAKKSFDLSAYTDELQTVDSSAVTHDMAITGNDKANYIIGTDEDDVIDGGAGKDTITGGDGNDKLNGGKGNDSLDGGKGNDALTGGDGADTFVFDLGYGKDTVTDYEEADKIKFTSGVIDTDSQVSIKGNDIIFILNKSNTLTVQNAKAKTITYVDDDGTHTLEFGKEVEYNSKGTAATLLANYSDNAFSAATSEYPKTLKNIDASAVNHEMNITGNGLANRITGSEEDDLINGGSGKDTILGGDGNDTIIGGKGNDSLVGGDGADVFVYNSGDGNDKIVDYDEEDVIQIDSGTIKKIAKSGKNVVFTIGSGKLTVVGAADKSITYIDKDGLTNYYPEPPVPTTVVDGKTITLTERYSKKTFDIADYDSNLANIDASAVKNDLEITANNKANRITGSEENDLINGNDGKDTIIGGDGNDTLIGGKGNDSLKGGDGADVFVYNSGDGNDKIVDYEEEDVIQFTSGTVTAKDSGNNVIFTVKDGKTTGKVTVVGGKEHVITYVDGSGKERIYPVNPIVLNSAGTAATLKSNYRATSFDVNTNVYVSEYSDILKTINGSAVTHDIEITGNKLANNLIGSTHNDTLIGGKGNDTLFGGDGQDVFVYNGGDGKDVIADYVEGEDVIDIQSGAIKNIKNSGNNVVFTVGTGSITVKDGKNKSITYRDADGVEHQWPNPWTVKGETVTLTDRYYSDTFNINDYDELKPIRRIDASSVDHDLSITGNAKNNVITGAAGNNTINGAKGNDTLYGGDGGANTYIYNNGDGNDIIYGFDSDDTLRIESGVLSGDPRVNGNTVIFTVGKGKISLDGAKGDPITIWYDGENITKIYHDNLIVDDNDIAGSDSDLSSIVRDGASSPYSVTRSGEYLVFTMDNNSSLPALAYSEKK